MSNKTRTKTRRGTGRKTRQRLPAEERRAQIIKAAQAVFVRQGFHGTRTRDLAEEAGVNEATLFLYFDSKQAIFDAAITEPLKTLIATEMADGSAFAAAIDPKSKEKIGTHGILGIYQVIRELYPLLTSALFSDQQQGQHTYRTVIYPLVERLRTAAKKSFSLKDNSQAEFVVLSAFGLCFMMRMHHDLQGIEEDADAMAARISHLLLHGLLK